MIQYILLAAMMLFLQETVLSGNTFYEQPSRKGRECAFSIQVLVFTREAVYDVVESGKGVI